MRNLFTNDIYECNKTLKQYIFRLIDIFGQIYYPLKSQEGQNVGPKIIENQ